MEEKKSSKKELDANKEKVSKKKPVIKLIEDDKGKEIINPASLEVKKGFSISGIRESTKKLIDSQKPFTDGLSDSFTKIMDSQKPLTAGISDSFTKIIDGQKPLTSGIGDSLTKMIDGQKPLTSGIGDSFTKMMDKLKPLSVNFSESLMKMVDSQKPFSPGFETDNQLNLADEINVLRRKLKKSVDELKHLKADNQVNEYKMKEYLQLADILTTKEKINHILTRISEGAREKLLNTEVFQKLFENLTKHDTVVISIDIRRSTELMLKARTPELFSRFITELTFKLSQIIILNFGIFDKFTGDGILAFFPKFYSGEKAIIRAIKAAEECHLIFKEHYEESKDCFSVFIRDVGLGIGIDYGNVTLVNTRSELTVVGVPVVYACRFSGTMAGKTLLNNQAKQEVEKHCPNFASFEEAEIDIKNEGIATGYHILLDENAFDIQNPNWDELIEKYKVESDASEVM
jgi:class 3 adenylate cyclase